MNESPTNESGMKVRLMKDDDFENIVKIDEKVLGTPRPEYYRMKFEKIFDTRDYLPTSLVVEQEEGTVVGFIMGELYMGEYGIFREEAKLDAIGVDPDCQHKGVGKLLITEFMAHMKSLGVQKVNTLVSWKDAQLMRFFGANKFTPSKTINLERSL